MFNDENTVQLCEYCETAYERHYVMELKTSPGKMILCQECFYHLSKADEDLQKEKDNQPNLFEIF